MRISDWSSDVCSSDLHSGQLLDPIAKLHLVPAAREACRRERHLTVHQPVALPPHRQEVPRRRAEEGGATGCGGAPQPTARRAGLLPPPLVHHPPNAGPGPPLTPVLRLLDRACACRPWAAPQAPTT